MANQTTQYKRTKKNRARAKRAEAVYKIYEPDPIEQAQDYTISDLICDLMHLAASRGFDVVSVISSAQNHFDCESIGMES